MVAKLPDCITKLAVSVIPKERAEAFSPPALGSLSSLRIRLRSLLLPKTGKVFSVILWLLSVKSPSPSRTPIEKNCEAAEVPLAAGRKVQLPMPDRTSVLIRKTPLPAISKLRSCKSLITPLAVTNCTSAS